MINRRSVLGAALAATGPNVPIAYAIAEGGYYWPVMSGGPPSEASIIVWENGDVWDPVCNANGIKRKISLDEVAKIKAQAVKNWANVQKVMARIGEI